MYRVILADDEPEICRGLRLKIAWERLGFEIAGEARNGKEALSAIASERPQLLLTDIRMPVMDGLELLQACKRLHPELRIVVLSGHDDFQYVQTALRCGARDYVLKPVVRRDLTELLETIRGELDAERDAARAREAIGRQWRQRLPDAARTVRARPDLWRRRGARHRRMPGGAAARAGRLRRRGRREVRAALHGRRVPGAAGPLAAGRG
ncbi:response regulator [Cohnella rhizosphaerae]|uniref:Response regulator n=1 Tax=Cohnella rhizosphaerae TaxID=1457232 RepID=A0A9X4L0J8_9BACL|nr:response regulator [Cohnella rhizosphaerae]MDG0814323.1 response regulator [Cohnella rhizosphaerae]